MACSFSRLCNRLSGERRVIKSGFAVNTVVESDGGFFFLKVKNGRLVFFFLSLAAALLVSGLGQAFDFDKGAFFRKALLVLFVDDATLAKVSFNTLRFVLS
jgi:hypothetical protein